ncbi:hypothetical protein HAAEEKHM_00025 [Sinorhizobium phage AP-16-3]|nr:hypothetical protein HAAEEKHM_00025 [Sinorhizobium phage AP-16-3]
MPSFKYQGTNVSYIDGIGGSIWKHLEQSRWYEQQMLEYISSLNRPGVYLDVGSNIGTHSVYFAMFCASTRVIGIEALPRHAQLATQFVEANNLGHKATILPVAVGEETGFLDAIHAIVEGEPRTFNALCVKIDDIAPSGISVIKMDIEGAEPGALKGALKTLQRDKPLLFIEAGSDEDLAEIEEVIGPIGYKRTGKVFNATPTYEFAMF